MSISRDERLRACTSCNLPGIVVLVTSPHSSADDPARSCESRAEALRTDICALADELIDELQIQKEGGRHVPLEVWLAVQDGFDALRRWRPSWQEA